MISNPGKVVTRTSIDFDGRIEMMVLSEVEVSQIAWRELLSGAESMAEDWLDEDGEFTEEDGDRIFQRMMSFIIQLQKMSVTPTLAQLGLFYE